MQDESGKSMRWIAAECECVTKHYIRMILAKSSEHKRCPMPQGHMVEIASRIKIRGDDVVDHQEVLCDWTRKMLSAHDAL